MIKSHNQTHIMVSDSCEVLKQPSEEAVLVDILGGIQASRLGSTSHREHVEKLACSLLPILRKSADFFLLFVRNIKDFREPCYKRDVCLDILDSIVTRPNFILNILCDQHYCDNLNWKNLANALTALPDLVANSGLLHRLTRFQPDAFYGWIIKEVMAAIEEMASSNTQGDDVVVSQQQKSLFIQIIGRISLHANFNQLIWLLVSRRALYEQNARTRSLITEILSLPLEASGSVAEFVSASTNFEMLIEPLYLPIFFNLKPSSESGRQIKSLLDNKILSHERLEYLICNKYILQTLHGQDHMRQQIILFNIFSYLSSLDDIIQNRKFDATSANNCSTGGGCCLLMRTLLKVAMSWSNETKILLRTYHQNWYISAAFVVAFRHAFENARDELSKRAEDVRRFLIQGTEVYLARASSADRNLAIGLSEVVAPKLDVLVDERRGGSRDGAAEPLKFDIELDDESVDLQRLLDTKLELIFDKYQDDVDRPPLDLSDKQMRSIDGGKEVKNEGEAGRPGEFADRLSIEQQKRQEEDGEGGGGGEGDDTAAPIYLGDCITGLSENNNPRFVKLCLIKAGELISELLKKREHNDVDNELSEDLLNLERRRNYDNSSSNNKNLLSLSSDNHNRRVYEHRQYHNALAQNIRDFSSTLKLAPATSRHQQRRMRQGSQKDDAIRDIALELAEVLLYLDDQFIIEGFDGLRMKAMSLLCLAQPDIVGKYLLDEFNGSRRGTRHQLDILMVLVACAKQLSSSSPLSSADLIEVNDGCSAGQISSGKAARSGAALGSTYANSRDPLARYKTNLPAINLADSERAFLEETRARQELRVKLTSTTQTTTPRRVGSSATSNKFAKYAALYFYGIVHQLKVDLNSSILSSLTKTTSGTNVDDDDAVCRGRLNGNSRFQPDDSYLLSRIFFSISFIIKCLNQQPVACKLSNDLLDILAAYKDHSDSGVRKSIISCLTAIRDCTPNVYFQEYLQDKTMYLFGSWLAKETEIGFIIHHQ